MASFDFDSVSRRYHIRFRYGGKPFKRSLPLEGDREAERVCGVIEEAIKDLKRGRLEIPAGADVGAFLLSGGKNTGKIAVTAVSESCQMTLDALFGTYERDLTPGSKEANTRETERTHRRNLIAHFGDRLVAAALDHKAVQDYVNARAAEGMAAKTLRLELGTLRMLWNWGLSNGHLATPLPWAMKRLIFPKGTSREPFQTWEQIERKAAALRRSGKLTPEKESSLWETLYLTEEQVMACLGHVREHSTYPFVYPMFAFCAYTGARRSEILRSERDDWDFAAGSVSIRQKKADTSRNFTLRQVPIHPALAEVMKGSFRRHPGGPYTICTSNQAVIGPRMATKYFVAALAGSKWAVVPGFHCFRHSIASIMASRGIDQRVINEILGHNTEDMVRRYRHLSPRKKEEAVGQLFETTS